MTFATYGITSYDAQFWNGSAWQTVSGGSITSNNKVWKKVTFAAISTTKIRVLSHASGDGYSRVAELEAWTTSSAQLHWLVNDQLGTPRMVFDETGSLANVSRHDYLPFGEELGAGTGGRTTAQGYSASDGVRQQFTGQQRDNETSLDYFNARYYSSTQGRFTSSDPVTIKADRLIDPQRLNLYSYVRNNPLVYFDPDGKDLQKGYGYNDKIQHALVELAKRPDGRKLLERLDSWKAVIKLGQCKGCANDDVTGRPNFEKIDGSFRVTKRDENGKAAEVTSRDGVFINADFDQANKARLLKGTPGETKGDIPKNDDEQVPHGMLHLVRQADNIESGSLQVGTPEYEANEAAINKEVRTILAEPVDPKLKADAQQFVEKTLEPKPEEKKKPE